MTNTTTSSAKGKVPAYIAYQASQTQQGFWERVGAAWPHKDGRGFNLKIEGTGLVSLRTTPNRQ